MRDARTTLTRREFGRKRRVVKALEEPILHRRFVLQVRRRTMPGRDYNQRQVI
jgi:hypothetical protein